MGSCREGADEKMSASKEKINEITAHKSTHQKECIYATPKKVVSL